MIIGLFKHHEDVAFHHRVAAVDTHLFDDAVLFGIDVVLHLHSFEEEESLAGFHAIAFLAEDIQNGAG